MDELMCPTVAWDDTSATARGVTTSWGCSLRPASATFADDVGFGRRGEYPVLGIIVTLGSMGPVLRPGKGEAYVRERG